MPQPPHDLRLFISFATANRDAAWEICQTLEARGFHCWISLRDLTTGSPYGDEIVRQIKDSEALVLVLSGAANDSEFVHREVERAVSYRTPIFPVRIEEVMPGPALELFVSANQWIDIWSGDSSSHMDRLAQDIRERHRRAGAAASLEPPGPTAQAPALPSVPDPTLVTSRGHGWARKYGGLVLAAAAVAAFGIANLSRSGIPNAIPADPASDMKPASGIETASDTLEPARTAQPPQRDSSASRAAERIIVRRSTGGARQADAATETKSDRMRAKGILVAVYGDPGSGAETVENILLGELSRRGHLSIDRATLDPASASSPVPVDSEQLGVLRGRSGVALVIVSDLRTEATPSVGHMYTGRATLSVRMYDTGTRRVIGTRTFHVGAGNTPGKIGASPMAASNEAATQIAYQAAASLAGDIRLWTSH